MIIAIDGPAASGKSTVARAVAERLGVEYLDTGAMYRAVAYRALAEGLPLDDPAGLETLARRTDIRFAHEDGSSLPTAVIVDDVDATEAIRSPAVDDAVSQVARVPGVRAAMVAKQRELARGSDTVLEGRDIGTVVFPDADVKVFLTASAEERARRRLQDMRDRGVETSADRVEESLVRRDGLDSSRADSPLAAAADAVELDTTGLTVDEVVERVVALVEAG